MLVAGCSSSDDDDNTPVVNDPVTPSDLETPSDPDSVSNRTKEGLSTVFDVASGGKFLNQTISAFKELETAEEAGFTFTGTTTETINLSSATTITVDFNTFECPDGGAVSVGVPYNNGGFITTRLNAEDCALSSFTVSGNYTYETGMTGSVTEEKYTILNLGIRSRVDLSVATTVTDTFINLNIQNNKNISQRWRISALSYQFDGQTYSVESADSNISLALSESTDVLDINIYGLTAPTLDGEVDVATTEPMRFDESITQGDPNFGRLSISSDFLDWSIDADGGDPESLLLTIDENDSQTSYLIPWSEGIRFKSIDINTINTDL
jgi:hypothetical protein